VSHDTKCAMACRKRLVTFGRQPDVFAPPASSLCRRFAHPRADQPLALEPFERHVRGADRQLAPDTRFDFAPNRGAIRVITQPKHGQQHEVLEFSQHMVHIVKQIDENRSRKVGPPSDRGPRRTLDPGPWTLEPWNPGPWNPIRLA